jgi:hypothetical protein
LEKVPGNRPVCEAGGVRLAGLIGARVPLASTTWGSILQADGGVAGRRAGGCGRACELCGLDPCPGACSLGLGHREHGQPVGGADVPSIELFDHRSAVRDPLHRGNALRGPSPMHGGPIWTEARRGLLGMELRIVAEYRT